MTEYRAGTLQEVRTETEVEDLIEQRTETTTNSLDVGVVTVTESGLENLPLPDNIEIVTPEDLQNDLDQANQELVDLQVNDAPLEEIQEKEREIDIIEGKQEAQDSGAIITVNSGTAM